MKKGLDRSPVMCKFKSNQINKQKLMTEKNQTTKANNTFLRVFHHSINVNMVSHMDVVEMENDDECFHVDVHMSNGEKLELVSDDNGAFDLMYLFGFHPPISDSIDRSKMDFHDAWFDFEAKSLSCGRTVFYNK